jgi:hypothetical protein
MATVFFAVSRDRAERLREGATYDGPGHAPSPVLLSAHDLSPGDDADYTALAYAGVAALQQAKPDEVEAEPVRLVLAADLPPSQVHDRQDPYGMVDLSGVRWDQVTALFADEVASAPVIAEARGLAGVRPLAEVVDDPDVERLLDSVDLLWFAPAELDFLWSD